MIAGIGTDITECARIEKALARHGKMFLEHLLTAAEQQESREQLSYCAGRWAAKEAVAKALGCGIGGHCAFTEIEILNNEAGKPEVSLSGSAAITAFRLNICRIHLSISHERHYAVATVILETP
ncbi:MAG: holo-ACP synthase [Lentisphaeria bacterium]|nr:holo-ACP synthase [Lentisphaeria bacterium]